MEKTYQVN